MRRYPAVLIGRLGINVDFRHQGIGSELLDFIKSWFIDEENKTGCRFLIVDAYNCMVPLGFYQKNLILLFAILSCFFSSAISSDCIVLSLRS